MVRHWVTINEINVLAVGTWSLGMFPPGRLLALGDVAIAVDNLLAAHVAGYEVIHRVRPDAVVTTNNSCMSIYEYDRLLIDLLLARSLGVERDEVGEWLAERRRQHDRLVAPGHGRAAAPRVHRGQVTVRRPVGRPPLGRVPVGPPGRPPDRFPDRSAGARPAQPGGEGGLRQPAPSAPSMPSASTTTIRWRPVTSGCRATGRRRPQPLPDPGAVGRRS